MTREPSRAHWSAHARFAAETALAVGNAIVVENVGIVTQKKGRANFATAADHAAEEAILDAIRRYDPGAPILAEESPGFDAGKAERLWVVDPLDGTLNFSRGLPFYCVAIGYVEDGKVRAGAVHAPRTGETFAASEGAGATLNGSPIRVSSTKTAAEAFAVTSLAFGSAAKRGSRFVALNSTCARLRILGAAALEIAYLASGRIDLFVHEFLSPWDIAAAQVIAREAGAAVVSLKTGRDAAWDEKAVIIGNAELVRDALAKMPLLMKRGR
ncbi:MAG TPA: inositol monophosphatase family protein [Candidatus Limnocylindria bacterium]|nr:inositol monophosphatase family protein [Candidatus Limnocylindria bacterium]